MRKPVEWAARLEIIVVIGLRIQHIYTHIYVYAVNILVKCFICITNLYSSTSLKKKKNKTKLKTKHEIVF